MSVTVRDPAAGPVTLTDWPRRRTPVRLCGYAVDPATGTKCPTPALYLFRMTAWGRERHGASCAEHAAIVRHWDGLAWMRAARPGELVGAGKYVALDPPHRDPRVVGGDARTRHV